MEKSAFPNGLTLYKTNPAKKCDKLQSINAWNSFKLFELKALLHFVFNSKTKDQNTVTLSVWMTSTARMDQATPLWVFFAKLKSKSSQVNCLNPKQELHLLNTQVKSEVKSQELECWTFRLCDYWVLITVTRREKWKQNSSLNFQRGKTLKWLNPMKAKNTEHEIQATLTAQSALTERTNFHIPVYMSTVPIGLQILLYSL